MFFPNDQTFDLMELVAGRIISWSGTEKRNKTSAVP